jgi:biopolymer transport protein ExbB/TolQ
MKMETDAQTPEVAPEIASAESLRGSRPGTDANTFIMIAFGIVATLVTSFGVMPLKGTKADYLYGIVNQRGPVQYLELLMSFMVVAMLMLKSRIVNRNLRVISSNPLPHDLDLNNDEGLQEFRASLPQRPEFAWSILLNRLDRAIALWLGSKDVGRVATWAQSESSRDQGSSDSSYALTRVLMWAIPILGFIGTVQGLGQAVAGFGVLGGSADVSAIKSAIGQVTVGLGVAFDTTLLALILTTLLMFPLTSFQRKEENLFGELDNYLDDVLLARLPSPEQKPIVIENLEDSIEAAFRRYIPDPDRYDEVFTRSIEKAAGSVEDKFRSLATNYEVTLKDLSERLAENLTKTGSTFEVTMRGVADDLRKQDEVTLEMRRKIGTEEAERFKSVVGDIHGTADRVAQEYRQGAEAIQASAKESVQQTMAAARELAARMADVSRMASGIQDLLKISQAVESSMAGLSSSDQFRATMDELRKHLTATTEFCNRLSKPRVITLREE